MVEATILTMGAGRGRGWRVEEASVRRAEERGGELRRPRGRCACYQFACLYALQCHSFCIVCSESASSGNLRDDESRPGALFDSRHLLASTFARARWVARLCYISSRYGTA